MTVDVIKEKIRNGKATLADLANGIRQDKYLLYNFLLDNNLNDVNVTLRTNLGYDKELPFVADRKKIEIIIDGFIRNNNNKALQTILNEFDFNPKANNYTTNPKFLAALNASGSTFSRFDFSQAATEVGGGIGGFLAPVLGSLGSSNTTQTTTENRASGMSVLVVFGVIIVMIGSIYFLFFNKPAQVSAAS